MTEFSADSPYIRRLAVAERVMHDGVSIVRAAGRILITTLESAIDTAVNSTNGEIDLYKIEHGDRGRALAEIEAHVNSPQAHKDL